jgi:hypothetical protein
MPQFECTACGASLYSAGATADLIDPRCPTCGWHSDRVRRPAHISRGPVALGGTHTETTRTHNRGHQAIVDRFATFMARGRPDEAARIDAKRWLDDGGRA